MNQDVEPFLSYRELRADERLRSRVRCFWEFSDSRSQGQPYAHQLLPDASISFALVRQPSWQQVSFVGPRLKAEYVPTYPGMTVWGVRFWPGALHGWSLQDATAWVGKRQALAEVLPELHRELEPAIRHAADFQAFVDTMSDTLAPQLTKLSRMDPAVALAIAVITHSGGDCQISELPKQVKLTQRQLERLVKCHVGMTMKQIARIQRLRGSAASRIHNPEVAWARIAVDQGYSDQSHLIRDFAGLLGCLPTELEHRLKQIHHRDVSP